jgi:hypothetical protein
MLPIVEKYWRSYENYYDELKQACLAFDKQDMGIIEFEDLKQILLKYGEQLDEDDIELFEKSVNVSDGKIIVDGEIFLSILGAYLLLFLKRFLRNFILRIYKNTFAISDRNEKIRQKEGQR